MAVSSFLEIQQFPLWDKLKSRRVPVSFSIEVTARCNNDCRHCFINLPPGDQVARENELSAAEINRIADQAVQLGAVWCLITGGEPLVRNDFADIYLALKKKGLLVSVFTNATLVNQEHIALFKEYPPRDIEITVYGVTRQTYQRVSRRSGTFNKFMRGFNMLKASGVRVRLKAMAIQSNLHEQADIAQFCRSHTKDFFRFDPQLHLRLDGDPRRNIEIRNERLRPEQIVALERADRQREDWMQQNCSALIDDAFTHRGCNHLFHCDAGNKSFDVSCEGKFRLCSSLNAPEAVYDLREGALADAWENFVPRIREMRSSRRGFLESCRTCSLVNLCLWCPAHAHLEVGELDGPVPYFCAVAHARAEALRDGMNAAPARDMSQGPLTSG
jgi:radical SAM protein with 4Fe4S-binding SPASM domain